MFVREMCWLSTNLNDNTKILHVRTNSDAPWVPYYAVPICNIPDYPIPRGSRGYAAMQHLMQKGWVLLPSPPESDVE